MIEHTLPYQVIGETAPQFLRTLTIAIREAHQAGEHASVNELLRAKSSILQHVHRDRREATPWT
jgi:hypothetical protein